LADVDAVVANRLRLLAEHVDELREYRVQASSLPVYVDTKMLRRAVERTLQVAVEICLDVGRHLASIEGFRYAEDIRTCSGCWPKKR
jgi:uncharacterized protein YutE (UPF0331/DUF86 family)